MRCYASGKPTLVIAAGDFSHMGPAFDPRDGLEDDELKEIETSDKESLSFVEAGDIDGFFDLSSKEKDERKLCGLSPIYLMGKFWIRTIGKESLLIINNVLRTRMGPQ